MLLNNDTVGNKGREGNEVSIDGRQKVKIIERLVVILKLITDESVI